MTPLERNREFLRQLIRTYSDKGLWAVFESQKKEDFLAMMEQDLTLGLLPGDSRQEIASKASKISDPLDNPFVEWIRDSVLRIIGSEKMSLEQIPVGLMLTKWVNARSFKGHHGELAIVFDYGLLPGVYLMLHMFFRCSRYHFFDPSADVRRACSKALKSVAEFCVSGDWDYLADIRPPHLGKPKPRNDSPSWH